MPMRRLLNESRTFDPKAVAILVQAFNGIVTELGLQAPAEREKAAKFIIQLAHRQPDLDAAKLRADAAALMRK